MTLFLAKYSAASGAASRRGGGALASPSSHSPQASRSARSASSRSSPNRSGSSAPAIACKGSVLSMPDASAESRAWECAPAPVVQPSVRPYGLGWGMACSFQAVPPVTGWPWNVPVTLATPS